MFGTILGRMILWELCKVFLIALIAITGILLLASLIAEATQQGLGPSQILTAIPLLVPSTLPYTIPATTLFATCVVYGRFSADNEILAIKATGLNLFHVVKPALALGVLVSAGTMGLYYHVIPHTHFLLRSMVLADAEEVIYTLLKRNRYIDRPNLPYSIFVQGVEGRKLIRPVIKHRNSKKQIDTIAHAREADLSVDLIKRQLVVRMWHGTVLNEADGPGGGIEGDFVYREFEMALPEPPKNHVQERDMTWQELGWQRQEFVAELAEQDVEIAGFIAMQERPEAPPNLPQHIKALKDKRRQTQMQIQYIDVEKHMRPALSLGCLCFILVGCPVGIWFSRGDYLSAFITCFLPVVLVYYPLMLCGTNLAKDGRFNEIALVYGADVVVGVAGVVLFRRLLRN